MMLTKLAGLTLALVLFSGLAGCSSVYVPGGPRPEVVRTHPDTGLNYYTEKTDRPSDWANKDWHQNLLNGNVQGRGAPNSLHNSESREFRPKRPVLWEEMVAYNARLGRKERTDMGPSPAYYPGYLTLNDAVIGLLLLALLLGAIYALTQRHRTNEREERRLDVVDRDGAIRGVTVYRDPALYYGTCPQPHGYWQGPPTLASGQTPQALPDPNRKRLGRLESGLRRAHGRIDDLERQRHSQPVPHQTADHSGRVAKLEKRVEGLSKSQVEALRLIDGKFSQHSARFDRVEQDVANHGQAIRVLGGAISSQSEAFDRLTEESKRRRAEREKIFKDL